MRLVGSAPPTTNAANSFDFEQYNRSLGLYEHPLSLALASMLGWSLEPINQSIGNAMQCSCSSQFVRI